MPRGRKPRTEQEKQLRGNPGKRDFRGGAPPSSAWDAIHGVPDVPESLSETEKARYQKLIDRYKLVPNLLSVIDEDILTLYVRAWTIIERCDILLQQFGLVCYSEKGGAYQHPALSARQKAVKDVIELGKLLGNSPKSRQDIRPGSVVTPESDPFEEFMQSQQVKVVA